MISAEPMPHELAVAHQGRIYWLNGCLHEDDLQRLLNRALVERGYDSKGMRRLHQLALVSGMDIGEYTRRHSMLPMDCIATFDGNERSENPVLMNDKPDRPGMPLYRSTVAYCCHECITEDLQKAGFSWYRRYHHLFGVHWCVVHRRRLSIVNAPTPFTVPPHIWLQQGRLMSPEITPDVLPEVGFLTRYTQISMTVLERGRPFFLGAISDALMMRAFEIGLRPSPSSRRPTLLSDHLSGQNENAWVAKHVAGWETKKPFEYFANIDRVLGGEPPTYGYLMAMAALYETAEDAMESVSRQDCQLRDGLTGRNVEHCINESRVLSANGCSDTETLFAECQRFIEPIVSRLGFDSFYVAVALSYLGLPNLYAPRPSDAWAALIRFLHGESVATACIAESASRSDLRALLGICCGKVLLTLRRLRRKFMRRSDPVECRKNVMVHLVQAR
ncbi:TniQ family protein [Paraburkholderia nemoris]|uniref:TniQ family protein n=1 Tax=Paraburkholderia nemoris TaxID=2793076 RepID=UPI001B23A418|nr:TniQ family protein [Paraburkholderia nemoris]CAE6748047.1 hypothetical protein LMG22931_02999 [Paraburkholderia nemoris]